MCPNLNGYEFCLHDTPSVKEVFCPQRKLIQQQELTIFAITYKKEFTLKYLNK